MITIYTNNRVSLDGRDTGLYVTQAPEGTRVYDTHGNTLAMPAQRYSLASNNPASGVPGRQQFAADLRALLATLAR